MASTPARNDAVQPVEEVPAPAKTTLSSEQQGNKRKRLMAPGDSTTYQIPSNVQSPTPAAARSSPTFGMHLGLWKDICKSGSELFNKAQEHFEMIAKNEAALIEDISRRLHLLQQTVQQQYQHALLTPLPTPQQKFLEVIQACLKSTNKCISTTAADLKRTTVNRMDEMEQEIHSLRSDIQQTETLQREFEAVNQRITMLQEEVTGKLNEILENQRMLPQIWSALQIRFNQQSSEAEDAVETTEELHLVDSVTDQSETTCTIRPLARTTPKSRNIRKRALSEISSVRSHWS
ncbi:unnamed protein product [Heligmosomoides polygyrus]|uniref:BLOC-1-related complex subunit 5 n=1 Tax=Heligmosomoides polygyrus TaxID=6339 RepID=A0A183GGT3_HELPZ|nr:unnamed protein product [Heligmosomoides polygyrus]